MITFLKFLRCSPIGRALFVCLLVLAVFGMLAVPPPVQAQETTQRVTTAGYTASGFDYRTLSSSNLATTAIWTNGTEFTIPKDVNTFNVQLTTFGLGAGSTGRVDSVFQKSMNRTNWLTGFTMNLVCGGTATNFCVTNTTAGAFPYWRQYSIANTALGVGTNALPVTTWGSRTGGF